MKTEFKIIYVCLSKAWTPVVVGFVLSTVQTQSEKLMLAENLTCKKSHK